MVVSQAAVYFTMSQVNTYVYYKYTRVHSFVEDEFLYHSQMQHNQIRESCNTRTEEAEIQNEGSAVRRKTWGQVKAISHARAMVGDLQSE